MAVRDNWQGKGVGTALMEAALDLADNLLDLTHIELEVFTDNQVGIALYKSLGLRKRAPTDASPSAMGSTLTPSPWPVSRSELRLNGVLRSSR
jgi:RimJ/RimL family protein N-acetyltransferase